jgi:hypothetical protein
MMFQRSQARHSGQGPMMAVRTHSQRSRRIGTWKRWPKGACSATDQSCRRMWLRELNA